MRGFSARSDMSKRTREIIQHSYSKTSLLKSATGRNFVHETSIDEQKKKKRPIPTTETTLLIFFLNISIASKYRCTAIEARAIYDHTLSVGSCLRILRTSSQLYATFDRCD